MEEKSYNLLFGTHLIKTAQSKSHTKWTFNITITLGQCGKNGLDYSKIQQLYSLVIRYP